MNLWRRIPVCDWKTCIKSRFLSWPSITNRVASLVSTAGLKVRTGTSTSKRAFPLGHSLCKLLVKLRFKKWHWITGNLYASPDDQNSPTFIANSKSRCSKKLCIFFHQHYLFNWRLFSAEEDATLRPFPYNNTTWFRGQNISAGDDTNEIPFIWVVNIELNLLPVSSNNCVSNDSPQSIIGQFIH